MGKIASVPISRWEATRRASDAIMRYDTDDRIMTAQYELQFEDGIKVANEVTAEFLADIHHLLDYHGQDWDAMLAQADAKYREHSEAVGS